MFYFQRLGGSQGLPSFVPAEKCIIQPHSGQLAALRMQALFQNTVHLSSLPRHCLSRKPVPGCLTRPKCPSGSFCTEESRHTQTHRVRILLSHFVLSPNKEKLFYLGAVALNKVTLNWRVLQKQWIPSIYANSCPLPNTRAA